MVECDVLGGSMPGSLTRKMILSPRRHSWERDVILAIGWLALAYWRYRKHSFRWWDDLISHPCPSCLRSITKITRRLTNKRKDRVACGSVRSKSIRRQSD